MKQRKLFHALSKDELVHIDSLKDKKRELLCPNCKKKVIAKQGSEKIWHFAHKEATCGHTTGEVDDGKNEQLAQFVTKTLDTIEVPEDPINFMCCKCYKKERKELGIRWDEKEFICKDCFNLS